jgi:hypothetical protein
VQTAKSLEVVLLSCNKKIEAGKRFFKVWTGILVILGGEKKLHRRGGNV